MIVGFVDSSFYLSIGRYGFTIGPWFLSLDLDNDIWRWYGMDKTRMTDFSFQYNISVNKMSPSCLRKEEQEGRS